MIERNEQAIEQRVSGEKGPVISTRRGMSHILVTSIPTKNVQLLTTTAYSGAGRRSEWQMGLRGAEKTPPGRRAWRTRPASASLVKPLHCPADEPVPSLLEPASGRLARSVGSVKSTVTYAFTALRIVGILIADSWGVVFPEENADVVFRSQSGSGGGRCRGGCGWCRRVRLGSGWIQERSSPGRLDLLLQAALDHGGQSEEVRGEQAGDRGRSERPRSGRVAGRCGREGRQHALEPGRDCEGSDLRRIDSGRRHRRGLRVQGRRHAGMDGVQAAREGQADSVAAAPAALVGQKRRSVRSCSA